MIKLIFVFLFSFSIQATSLKLVGSLYKENVTVYMGTDKDNILKFSISHNKADQIRRKSNNYHVLRGWNKHTAVLVLIHRDGEVEVRALK